jgi:hypothetical protein
MHSKIDPTLKSLNWYEIWRIALFHPTVRAFSQISNDPQASTSRGVIWAAISSLIAWCIGPQRAIFGGMVADAFGLRSLSSFYLIGALVAPLLGVGVLLLAAAIAHGFARLLHGAGAFHRLVYCWAVLQLPFILLSGMLVNLPSLLLSPHAAAMSTAGMVIQITSLLLAIGVILYLAYAQLVAFSAVEKFGIWKSLGVLILLAALVGSAGLGLSLGFQAVLRNIHRY